MARVPPACSISVDPSLSTIHAEGTEESIITLGQQISWLSGVCRNKLDDLSHAYIGFTVGDSTSRADVDAVFKINVRLQPCNPRYYQGCWNSSVGSASIISWFPIPQRPEGARGLEISVTAMSAMAGIPHAISFEGGFIFKGRHHALVPVQTIGRSVQWHMLDTYPKKLDWADIRKHCPTNIKGHIQKFAKYRSCVGWYPDAGDLIGMLPSQYTDLTLWFTSADSFPR